MVHHRNSRTKEAITTIRNYFLAGLAFAVPLIATIWILALVYRVIGSISQPLVNILLPGEINPPDFVKSAAGFLIIVLILVGLGFMAKNVIGTRVLAAVDQFLLKIPFVATIYKSLQQAIDSFKDMGAKRSFKRVAYVEYPSPGYRLVGFVTSQYFDHQINKGVTCVFVPTSPNPITGFVLVVEDEKVIDSTLTLEEATKIIFSGGLVSPDQEPPLPKKETVPESTQELIRKLPKAEP